MNEKITTIKDQTLTIQKAIDLAVQHHEAGDFPKAEGVYQQVLQAEPNQPVALHLLGVIAHQVGKNDIAIDLITKALAVKPDFAEAHSNLGNAFQALGQLDEAVVSYNKALSIDPDYAEAHSNLGLTLQGLGKLDEAVESFNTALEIKPNYIEAHYNLGITLQAHGKLDEAVESFNKAIKIKPNFVEAHNNIGNILKEFGKLDEAVESYNKAITIKPDYAEAHSNLGLTLQALGNLDEAVESYNKALAIKPYLAGAHSNLGNALDDQGKLDAAVDCYNKALAINPDYAEVHYNLGNTHIHFNRLDEAVASYNKAIAIKPDYAEAYINLGTVLQTLGNIDAAATAFRAAFKQDPASHMSLFYQHSTYYRNMNTDFEAAIKCLNDAVQIAPTNGLINFFLGMLLDYKGHNKKAEQHFLLVHKNLLVNYAHLESWNWVKSYTSKYPLLFWQKDDGFCYAFDAAKIDGLILEFGVGHGASIRKLASMTDRVIHGFDSFQGLPESWSHLPKGAFNANGEVPLAPNHAKFHVGLFDQTLPPFLIEYKESIKFLNIDCDLYSSTKTVFDLVEKRIVSGTVIFFDEYFGYHDWHNHEFKAFQEAVKKNGWRYDYLAINIFGQQAVVMIL
jgi:tetratricopeptide (TPR) repeat protein